MKASKLWELLAELPEVIFAPDDASLVADEDLVLAPDLFSFINPDDAEIGSLPSPERYPHNKGYTEQSIATKRLKQPGDVGEMPDIQRLGRVTGNPLQRLKLLGGAADHEATVEGGSDDLLGLLADLTQAREIFVLQVGADHVEQLVGQAQQLAGAIVPHIRVAPRLIALISVALLASCSCSASGSGPGYRGTSPGSGCRDHGSTPAGCSAGATPRSPAGSHDGDAAQMRLGFSVDWPVWDSWTALAYMYD
jgi:hypothetical protein